MLKRLPATGAASMWLGIILVATAGILFAETFPWISKYPSTWTIPLAEWISAITEAVAEFLRPFSRALSWLLELPMIAIRDGLQWLPWPAAILFATAVAVASGAGMGVVVFTVASLAYVLASGYWAPTMNTLALVAVAVPLSMFLGLAGGVAIHTSKRARAVIIPLLDLMQTMPTFAYLIPILFMFGFGPVVGLIASAIFATPPMVRNVVLGLQRVPSEVTEAGHIAGTSYRQQLLWVELPAAIAQLKVGINQTIMAALSMVIIAAVIGGFDDIGWEVLSNMRKARFGDGLLSGSVIVLVAVMLDRVSAAFATRDPASESDKIAQRQKIAKWLAIAGIVAAGVGYSLGIQAPTDVVWIRELSAAIDLSLSNFVAAYGDVLTSIKNATFYYYLLPVRIGFNQAILPFTWGFVLTPEMKWGYFLSCTAISALLFWRRSWQAGLGFAVCAYLVFFGLTGAPWLVLSLAMLLITYLLAGVQTTVFVFAVLVVVLSTGLWDKAMLSVYLCGSAAILAFLFGAMLGIFGAVSDRFSRFLRPVLDTFQTIPLFVFLIPVLMLFQIGEFTALLAIIAYAFVPAARYTENGLRQIPEEMVEVARMQGCTPMQILWQIKLPMAMPVILLGLNQTVLFSFSMLVIAALVGTTGLGQAVYVALSSADVGGGIVAGCAMAFLAMIADRVLRAWAERNRVA